MIESNDHFQPYPESQKRLGSQKENLASVEVKHMNDSEEGNEEETSPIITSFWLL